MLRRQNLVATAAPLRACLETVILEFLIWGLLTIVRTYIPTYFTRVGPFSLISALCMLFFIVRLRQPAKFSVRQTFLDILVGLLVVGALSAMDAGFSYLNQADRRIVHLGVTYTFGLFVIDAFFNSTVGFFGRVAVRFLLIWNQLRRKHLLWELTHAHVMMLALIAGFIILAFDTILIAIPRNYSLESLIVFTLFLIILSIIVMVIVISPIALFSYFVLRRTTNRLKILTDATGSLRSGLYGTRVPVVGEDEVAQLQSDFNAMAANLERAMKDLQEERDRVSSLLQERRELIANVSHELRTPVATMRGYLETTLMRWDEMSQKALYNDLQVMEGEVIQLQERVEDLFTLARADVGKLTLRNEPTDVCRVVQGVVSTRAPLAWRSSRIEVVAEFPDKVPLIMADTRRLEQALLNLIHNGLRHTSPGGIVAVVVDADADTVSIHVKDTGEGIAPNDLLHIWERFYQSESTRTRMGGGTGLGLALVKEWVEGMNGSVAVESVLGEGSCFTLRFPRNLELEKKECEQVQDHAALPQARS
jgi:signal transduction histidine kinase